MFRTEVGSTKIDPDASGVSTACAGVFVSKSAAKAGGVTVDVTVVEPQ